MAAESLRIRPALAQDAALILSFIQALASYEKLAHEVIASERQLAEQLFGPDPAAEVLIAEWAGKPAGFALYFRNFSTFIGKPGLYLEDLFVHPEFRDKGIGKALIRAVAQEVRRRGYARFEWSVLNWNEPAIGFYQALGAQPMNGWTVYRLCGEALHKFATGSD